jgi:pimeloyl-ACP methyl ester carboxylesterase
MPLSAGLYYFHHEGGNAGKPPMVLLHGAGGDCLVWPPEIRRLPGIRVYALDLPGHGKSGGPGCQSVEEYARAVVGLMDAVGLWRAAFVGHSMGGAIALTLALDFPERTAGLGLVSSGPRLPVPAPILENAASPSTFAFGAQTLHALIWGPHGQPGQSEQDLKRLTALRPTLLHGDLLACDRFDVTSRLASIRTPVLVTCGTEDKFTPPRYSSALAASIPGAALQTVDGAGHLVMREQPHRLAKLLSVFLMTIPYTPGA